MRAELKKEWLAALRSGEYEQGRGCLRSDDGSYCCLGVLADILPGRGWEFGGAGRFQCRINGERMETILTHEILEMRHQVDLTVMNDRQEAGFNEIADWIEEEVFTDEG